MTFCNKRKKKCKTIGIFPQSKRKIVESSKIDPINTST